MNIDYNDERFQQVEREKQQAIEENNSLYGNMINDSNAYYDNLINAQQDYANTQTKLQQEQTDFALQQIEQQKAQATKDYEKEQKGAYVDYQKQTNRYGANAEIMATSGLANTGYSESSRVSMFNTYQNRVATARESYNNIIRDYDNDMTQARLANNSALAQIAYQALENRLKLSLEGFQYRNNLLQQSVNAKNNINDRYYSRYQDVLAQINKEKAFEEEQRQFNEQLALSKKKVGSSGGSISKGGNSIDKTSMDYSSLDDGIYYGDDGSILEIKNGNKNITHPEGLSPVTNTSSTKSTTKNSTNGLATGVKIGMSLANPVVAAKNLAAETIKKLFK